MVPQGEFADPAKTIDPEFHYEFLLCDGVLLVVRDARLGPVGCPTKFFSRRDLYFV